MRTQWTSHAAMKAGQDLRWCVKHSPRGMLLRGPGGRLPVETQDPLDCDRQRRQASRRDLSRPCRFVKPKPDREALGEIPAPAVCLWARCTSADDEREVIA